MNNTRKILLEKHNLKTSREMLFLECLDACEVQKVNDELSTRCSLDLYRKKHPFTCSSTFLVINQYMTNALLFERHESKSVKTFYVDYRITNVLEKEYEMNDREIIYFISHQIKKHLNLENYEIHVDG